MLDTYAAMLAFFQAARFYAAEHRYKNRGISDLVGDLEEGMGHLGLDS